MCGVTVTMLYRAGGVAGLVVCLFAKYNKRWRDWQRKHGLEGEVYHVRKWWCFWKGGREEAQVSAAQLIPYAPALFRLTLIKSAAMFEIQLNHN